MCILTMQQYAARRPPAPPLIASVNLPQASPPACSSDLLRSRLPRARPLSPIITLCNQTPCISTPSVLSTPIGKPTLFGILIPIAAAGNITVSNLYVGGNQYRKRIYLRSPITYVNTLTGKYTSYRIQYRSTISATTPEKYISRLSSPVTYREGKAKN